MGDVQYWTAPSKVRCKIVEWCVLGIKRGFLGCVEIELVGGEMVGDMVVYEKNRVVEERLVCEVMIEREERIVNGNMI
ncbi:hypothetical protein NDU88_007341 [Pleurodeles waltl]|uniref:Uncharacterized protein n=1 Tax=Pleurodeles waltl TaxID=8319 RepID=A0AAV7PLJ6_PLEWA|nr:hypothetical protein NDU88_007341 [Pleurodeles waltl]